MPRARKHPNAATSNPAVSAAPASPDRPTDSIVGLESYALGTGREYNAPVALLALCSRGDGWLRIVPHDFGKRIYAKYKFICPKFPNHYVMYVADELHVVEMLWGLLRKVEEVDEGLLKPTYDTPYNAL